MKSTPYTTQFARFIGIHFIAFAGTLVTGVTWEAAVCCIALYCVHMFAVTAGYHRYFSHQTFKTSRIFQFVLAWCAESSTQKGVIWWAEHHRHHHRNSDSATDVHSPRQQGFWYAHVGWIFDPEAQRAERKPANDLREFPELVFLDRHWLLPPIITGVMVLLVLGWSGLFAGFFVSMVLVWHATYTINSLAHLWGTKRFDTNDDSRNNLFLALITFGEGWHNNHHRFSRSTRQGFRWWQVDVTYYVLKLMSSFGLVWDIHKPPGYLRGPPCKPGAVLSP